MSIVNVYPGVLAKVPADLQATTPVQLQPLQDASVTTLPANLGNLSGAPTQTDGNNIIALLNACATALRNHGLAQ